MDCDSATAGLPWSRFGPRRSFFFTERAPRSLADGSLADARRAIDDRLATGEHATPFATLDELVRTGTAVGLVHVQGDAATLTAVARHVERRTRAAQRSHLHVDGSCADDAWRELADRLGARKSTDPADVATSVVTAAGCAVIVVSEAGGSEWGEAILAEIARAAGPADSPLRALFVVLAPYAGADRGDRVDFARGS